jgi:hypothetical protein
MKNLIVTILAFVFIAFFLGCATKLAKNECLQADWYEIGYIDGTEGAPRSLFQEHAETCLKYNVHVGREAYYRGRDQGLKVYCRKDKGFDLGRLGRKYNPICPQDLEPDFHAGYANGRETYKNKTKISSLKQRLQRIENQIQSKEKQLHFSGASEERRSEIRADIKNLEFEHKDTVRDLRDWEKKDESE